MKETRAQYVGMARCLLALGAFFVVIGCTHAIPMKGAMETPIAVNQVPLKVGVYYAPEFRNYVYKGSRGGDRWDFPLGSASVKLFDQIFPETFAKVAHVDSRPPFSGSPSALDAVLEPKIEYFEFSLPFLKTGTYAGEITYRFTLYSLKGEPITSWTVRGTGAKHGQVGFEFARWPGEAADLAMQDAATKFMTGFSEIPEVQRWIRQAHGSPSK
jgi:hypothetical protein